jgi:hypothetical protein
MQYLKYTKYIDFDKARLINFKGLSLPLLKAASLLAFSKYSLQNLIMLAQR